MRKIGLKAFYKKVDAIKGEVISLYAVMDWAMSMIIADHINLDDYQMILYTLDGIPSNKKIVILKHALNKDPEIDKATIKKFTKEIEKIAFLRNRMAHSLISVLDVKNYNDVDWLEMMSVKSIDSSEMDIVKYSIKNHKNTKKEMQNVADVLMSMVRK